MWSFVCSAFAKTLLMNQHQASGEEDKEQAARMWGPRGDVSNQMTSASFFKQTFTEQLDANSCSGYWGYSSGHPQEYTYTHTLLPFRA